MKTLLTSLWLVLGLASSQAAEPYRITLTSSSKQIHLDHWSLSGADVTPEHPDWSITKQTLHGGKQEGVDLITVDRSEEHTSELQSQD